MIFKMMNHVYVFITTRCNQSCEHCILAATSEGEDMSLETFEETMKVIPKKFTIVLSGGEPLLHARYKEFVEKASKHNNVIVSTNGTITDELMWSLEYMEENKGLSVYVSQTKFHTQLNNDTKLIIQEKGGRIITDLENIWPGGRAINLAEKSDGSYCACNHAYVWPDGNIKNCGCPDSEIIGNINDAKVNLKKRRSCKRSPIMVGVGVSFYE